MTRTTTTSAAVDATTNAAKQAFCFTEARAQFKTPFEGFAAEDLGFDGAFELRKTVESLWSGTFRQPIEIAVRPSHVAVSTGRNVNYDFSLRHETTMSVCEVAGQESFMVSSKPGLRSLA